MGVGGGGQLGRNRTQTQLLLLELGGSWVAFHTRSLERRPGFILLSLKQIPQLAQK